MQLRASLRGWLASAAVACISLAFCAGLADAQMIMKIATVNSGDNPRNISANEFARVVGEASKGKIKGEVYINNQLARGEGAMLEGIQLGTIDIAPVGSAPIGGIFEQAWKVMDGPIGDELLKKMEAKGVKGLCWGGGWGFRNMLSNVRPIVNPDDMKGQTVRIQESPTYTAMMKELGANPVPMPYGEVYLAMKQGTVDGMELPVFTAVSDKFHEVTKFYSLTKHTYPPIAWFTNLRKYNALAPDLRAAVDQAAKAACAMDRKAELQKEEEDLAFMKKSGVKVNDVADLKAFQSRMKPAYDFVTGKVGQPWMDKVLAAVKAAE